MLTAALVELRIYRRNPELLMLVLLPIILITILTRALEPVLPGGNPYQSTVVGFALMFAFYGMSWTADAIFRDRVWGNWPRLLSLPVSRWRILAGKVIGPLSLVTFQIGSLVVFGALVYDVRLGSIPSLVVMVVLSALAASSLGLLLASFGRTQVELNQISNVAVLALASIGGAIAPVSRLPSPLRHLAPATPHYWALKGFRTAMAGHGGLADLAGPVLYLVVFTLAAFVLGVAAFRFDRMTQPPM